MAERRSQPVERSLDQGRSLGGDVKLTHLASGMLRPQRTGPRFCFSLQQAPCLK